MSQRVIDDPAAAGWEFDADTGYWMWKGEEGTGGLWEQNGDDIYYEDGNVLVGGDTFNNGNFSSKASGINAFGEAPMVNLIESGGNTSFYIGKSDSACVIGTQDSQPIKVYTNDLQRMTIDADGNVGIGTDNPTSSLTINQESTGQSSRVQTTNGTQDLYSGVWAGLSRIVSLGSQFNIGTDDDNSLVLRTKNADRMTIDASGDVTLAHPAGLYGRRTSGDLALKLIGYVPGTDNVELVTSNEWLLKNGSGNTLIKASSSGRVDIPGTLYVNGTPKIGYSELITTLTTLRNATMDETQDIRESLRDAIDELVAGFEQEIAAMPVEETE
jgi:hypothetical protein